MRWTFSALLAAGLLIRAAALPLPGTGDFGVWRVWTYNGAVDVPGQLYGTGSPPDWRMIEFDGVPGPVVYPPLALYELSGLGRVYRAVNRGAFPNTVALTIAIKLLILLFEASLVWLIFVLVRRRAGTAAGRWAAVAYWLNPGAILASSMLGYIEAFFALPAVAAFAAAGAERPFLAGGLTFAAALTKPQAAILIPAAALAAWKGTGRRARGAIWFALGAAVSTLAILAPVLRAHALPNLMFVMSRLAHHDMLSGNACNLWWLVGYVLRVAYSAGNLGLWSALTMQTRILTISRVLELGYPNPRVIGAVLTLGAIGWSCWTVRRARDWFLMPALGAFHMHAYATLAAQVHENHLFATIPLLVLAAAGRPEYRPLAWVVSAIFAVNLNLFYGISEYQYLGRFMIPRRATVVDLTVLLAVANCAALAWHGVVLRRAAHRPPSVDTALHPVSVPATT